VHPERSEVTSSQRDLEAGFSLVELMTVAVVMIVIAAIAVPFLTHMMAAYRMASAAKSIAFQLKMTRVRASSAFTLARLNCNNSTTPASCQIERCQAQVGNGLCDTAPNSWAADGDAQPLPSSVAFGFGSLSKAPTGTQSTIAETYQIVFNSRGLAVDVSGATQVPTSNYALYLRDGANPGNDDATYAITVAPAGAVSVWQYSSAVGDWGGR